MKNEFLKENIREIEAALSREREFAKADHRLNTEYLVNVLRKFFLSSDVIEKANLVPVICAILRFRPEETRSITGKWAPPVKSKGFVGWLLLGGGKATAPNPTRDDESKDEFQSPSTLGGEDVGWNGEDYNGGDGSSGVLPGSAVDNPIEGVEERATNLQHYKEGIGGLDIY